MLPSAHRLRRTNEIERVRKRGRSFSSAFAQVRVAPNGGGPTRFAVVVSTKTEKRAVRRNRVKRRTREILRSLLPRIVSGADAIVTLRREAIAADFALLEAGLARLLTDARLLRTV
jgi:ribonuclease P protein component